MVGQTSSNMLTSRRLAVIGALCALTLGSRAAHALYADDEGNLTLGASFRTTTCAIDMYDVGAMQGGVDGLSLSSLRLTADGDPSDWFSYELHTVQDVQFGTAPSVAPSFGFLAPTTSRYRLVEGSVDWVTEPDFQARLWWDRASLKYHLPGFDVEVGRQAVTFGKAHFWNPLDVFLPFDARQFDREYKSGVDALRIDIPVGMMSGINVVMVPGRVDGARVTQRSWYGSALVLRGYTNIADWDLAAQGGKIYGGAQVGGGFTGTLGPVELRGEAAYFHALRDAREPVFVPSHWLGVAGLGRLFDCSLNLQAEYLYNGAGNDDSLDVALSRLAQGRALQMSEHVAGAVASYDLLPILSGSVAVLASLSDGSAAIQPGLVYSVSDESDVLVGALVALGEHPEPSPTGGLELKSEFGSYPSLYYVEYKLYF